MPRSITTDIITTIFDNLPAAVVHDTAVNPIGDPGRLSISATVNNLADGYGVDAISHGENRSIVLLSGAIVMGETALRLDVQTADSRIDLYLNYATIINGRDIGALVTGDDIRILNRGEIVGHGQYGVRMETDSDAKYTGTEGLVAVLSDQAGAAALSMSFNTGRIDSNGIIKALGADARAIDLTISGTQSTAINLSGEISGTAYALIADGGRLRLTLTDSLTYGVTTMNGDIDLGGGIGEDRLVNHSIITGDIYGFGIHATGIHASQIQNYGTIDGNITMSQGHDVLLNGIDGVILGNVEMGIGRSSITNHGLIDGDIHSGGQHYDELTNSGTITGDVRLTGLGGSTVTNSGTINGDIVLGGSTDIFINTGSLEIINMGGGDDIFIGNQMGANSTQMRVNGNAGNDILRGGNANDRFFGGDGHDLLQGNDGNDTLLGQNGSDTLEGGIGSDRLIGGRSGDRLVGGQGDDRLYGQTGQDTLIGGDGDDMLYGGSGADIFVFSGTCDADTIADYHDQDFITLTQIYAFTGPLVDFALISNNTTYSNGNAFIDISGIYADINWTYQQRANASVTILNIAPDSLTADDFIL